MRSTGRCVVSAPRNAARARAQRSRIILWRARGACARARVVWRGVEAAAKRAFDCVAARRFGKMLRSDAIQCAML
eukprot:3940130-Lingulodinium_polyedra.AAC.1